MYRYHEIGTLIRYKPEAAAREILDLIRDHRGNVAACAQAANVTRRTFVRWIAALDEDFNVRAFVRAARANARRTGAGWYRPRSNDSENVATLESEFEETPEEN